VIDDCTDAFKEFESVGFEFGEIGYAGNHVHFRVNVPKKYSVEDVETMLKSNSAKIIFERHPNFRKRYPNGSFWSGYEHHESTGFKDITAADTYIKNQLKHHNVRIIDDRQSSLHAFGASQDTAISSGVAE
jgi:REP element-mobilizing transposase RayT